MQKLSVLIFSRNDVEKAIGLAQDVYEIASEIVIIDSSDKKGRDTLEAQKKKLGLTKLKVLYAVALGYPDPLRMYALKKCSSEWVLLLDVDERLSTSLKTDIGSILKSTRSRAFSIKRYEGVKDGKLPKLFTRQIRLFRRDAVTFKGLLHEHPLVHGNTTTVDDYYYIEHRSELMHHGIHEYREYLEIRKFERFSYSEYNDRMLNNFSNVTGQKNDNSISKKMLKGLLNTYETVTFRNRDSELINFDYSMYFFLMEFVFALKQKSPVAAITALPRSQSLYMSRVRKWRKAPDAAQILAIAKIINKVGIIRYLGLDQEKTIAYLNRKYKNKQQGIQLLIKLLKNKYEHRAL